jgi:hypothetical protein
MSTTLSFLKVLLGTGRFEVLGAWWAIDGGRSGCGSPSFRHFVIVVIFFFLGMFLLSPHYFLGFKLLRCCCYIYIVGESLFRGGHSFGFS